MTVVPTLDHLIAEARSIRAEIFKLRTERSMIMVQDARLPTLTVAELLKLVEVRGVELPPGRLSKAKIVELLRASPKQKAQTNPDA